MTVAREWKKSATTAHRKAIAIEIVVVKKEKRTEEKKKSLLYISISSEKLINLLQTSQPPDSRQRPGSAFESR